MYSACLRVCLHHGHIRSHNENVISDERSKGRSCELAFMQGHEVSSVRMGIQMFVAAVESVGGKRGKDK